MANSKDGQGHKDKFLDTSAATWNTHGIYSKAVSLTVQKLLARLIFFNRVKLQGQGYRFKIDSTHWKVLSQGILK